MSEFADELQRWFPPQQSLAQCPSLDEAFAYSRRLATSHYENFPIASCFLPKHLHQHFFNVYGFCRWADDLGDELGDSQKSLAALKWWRDELEACYAGEARHPVYVALQPTVRQFDIPAQLFRDLISAFEQDQTVVEYANFDSLRDYCRRSADPVGRIVLYLCGQFTEQHAAWSDSICTGLQLANFWQDVARDLDIGRIYLPQDDCDRFGFSRDDLRAKVTTPAFIELMRFEVARAREWLLAGLPLIERLPGRLQIDIDLFAQGGLCILDRIEAIGFRVLEQRPVVRKSDVLKLLLGSLSRALWRLF